VQPTGLPPLSGGSRGPSLQPGSADPIAAAREIFHLHARKVGEGGTDGREMVGLGGAVTGRSFDETASTLGGTNA